MGLTEEQQEAAANLVIAYRGACGFDPDNQEAVSVYDSLVAKGHAVAITEDNVSEFADGRRAHRLSDEAVEAHHQLIQAKAD